MSLVDAIRVGGRSTRFTEATPLIDPLRRLQLLSIATDVFSSPDNQEAAAHDLFLEDGTEPLKTRKAGSRFPAQASLRILFDEKETSAS